MRTKTAATVPFSRPWIGREEIRAVAEVLRSGWLTTGPKVTEFEARFRQYTGCRFAVATNSCTGALHAALLAMGVGPGDEVITTTFTFVATAHVALYVGARPVLVDIEKDTFNIDPQQVEKVITERSRAVIPVHYAGHPCEMNALEDLARRNGLALIEDAAHALGAEYRGRKIGTIGDATAFSFYPTKNITTGEGGMLTTASSELEASLREAVYFGIQGNVHGRYQTSSRGRPYEVASVGYKYNMDSIQAALGLIQLERLDHMNRLRAAHAEELREALSGVVGLGFQALRQGVVHANHIFPILLPLENLAIGREEFMAELAAKGIGTSVHFVPVHLHRFYGEKFVYRHGDFPVAEETFGRIVSLPLFPRMSQQEIRRVIGAVKEVIQRNQRRRSFAVRTSTC